MRLFGLCIPRQPQCPQALHVLNSSFATRLLLPQCIIDFCFSPLIPIEYSFCDFKLLCSEDKKSFSRDKASDIQRCGDASDVVMKVTFSSLKISSYKLRLNNKLPPLGACRYRG